MNALSPGLVAEPALVSLAHPDADLIRLCAEHIVNLTAYNKDGGMLPPEVHDPLWDNYAKSRDAISEAKPRTLEGMLAKARAAKAEAQTATTDDGEMPEGTPAANWSWDLVNDLLATDAVALPIQHPDAALMAACAEHLRVERAFEAYYDTLPGDMEPSDPHYAILKPLAALEEQIVAAKAVTVEGIMARWRCAAFYYLPNHQSCRDNPDEATEDRFAAACLRDMVLLDRGAATSPAPSHVAFSPDAQLLAACASFDALERQYQGSCFAEDDTPEGIAGEAERERIVEAQEPHLVTICAMPATTPAGLRAKAASLVLWDEKAMMANPSHTNDMIRSSLLRDLLAGVTS